MKETCQTCEHWDRRGNGNHEDIVRPYDPDTYEEMDMPFKVGRCTSPKLLRFERPLEPSGASVCDGSEYMANLFTGEDFGCINYLKRP